MEPRPLAVPRWPRVYRPTRSHQVLLGGLGGLLALGGLFGAAWLLLHRPLPAGESRVLLLVPAILAALGAFLIVAVARERVVLHQDAIEFFELGRGSHRFRRDEILGRRLIPMQYGMEQLVLELRGHGRKPFKVMLMAARDEVLDAWWASIPDLDAADRQRSEAELLGSQALGGTPAERAQALRRARRTATALRVVALAVGAWGWFAPRPYPLVMALLAALPAAALAVVVVGRGRYSLEGQRNDVRPELLTPLLVPGLVLALRVLIDVPLVDHQPLLAWSALGGLGLGAVLAAGDAALRRRALVLGVLVLLQGAYAWGLLGAANALFDRGPGQDYRVAVTGKHVSTGKHTTHDLRLASFGPVEARDIDVGRAMYQATPVGGTVCVQLHDGALGARWLAVQACP